MKASTYLDLTGTLDGQLVLLRQFVHTKNGNDILEGLVVLKDLLDGSGNLIMLLANLYTRSMSDHG